MKTTLSIASLLLGISLRSDGLSIPPQWREKAK